MKIALLILNVIFAQVTPLYLTIPEADWRQERGKSSNKHIVRKGDVSSKLFQPYGSLTIALSESISRHMRYDAALTALQQRPKLRKRYVLCECLNTSHFLGSFQVPLVRSLPWFSSRTGDAQSSVPI